MEGVVVTPPASSQDYGSNVSPAPSGSGSGAPTDATYVTLTTNATLTNERVLTAGSGITVTDAGAGSTVTVAAPAVAAQYVTMATSADLANERVLTAGANVTITDGGAGGNVTIAAAYGSVSANFTALFGSGAAGSVTFDGAAAVTGFTLAANVYTANSTVGGTYEFTDFTINNGVEVKMVSRQIFATGTATVNGTLSCRGGDAAANVAGAGNAADWAASSQSGQAGALGAQTAGTNISAAIGGAGGQGGTNAVNPAQAAAGTVTPPTTTQGGLGCAYSPYGIYGARHYVTAALFNSATAGNRGSGDGTNNSGAGGGAGGTLGCYLRIIAGSGTISAKGGNGGTPAAGNCGGGGGGGGGVILCVTSTANWQSVVTVTVAGGTKGAPSGTGNNDATNGAAGRIISMIV